LRSIRSSSRARTTDGERGFALIWAVGLALLFFMLIELMLIDSARELAEARRFRAKIVAATLAEHGAEPAARQMITQPGAPVREEDFQGTYQGTLTKGPVDPASGVATFVVVGEGEAKGISKASARVEISGYMTGTNIAISFTKHTQ